MEALKIISIKEGKAMQTVKTFTKSEGGRLRKVLEYRTGAKVEVPINRDGSIRWYKDKPKVKTD